MPLREPPHLLLLPGGLARLRCARGRGAAREALAGAGAAHRPHPARGVPRAGAAAPRRAGRLLARPHLQPGRVPRPASGGPGLLSRVHGPPALPPREPRTRGHRLPGRDGGAAGGRVFALRAGARRGRWVGPAAAGAGRQRPPRLQRAGGGAAGADAPGEADARDAHRQRAPVRRRALAGAAGGTHAGNARHPPLAARPAAGLRREEGGGGAAAGAGAALHPAAGVTAAAAPDGGGLGGCPRGTAAAAGDGRSGEPSSLTLTLSQRERERRAKSGPPRRPGPRGPAARRRGGRGGGGRCAASPAPGAAP